MPKNAAFEMGCCDRDGLCTNRVLLCQYDYLLWMVDDRLCTNGVRLCALLFVILVVEGR